MSHWVDSRRKIAIPERKLHVKELENKPCESRITDTNPEHLSGELHSTICQGGVVTSCTVHPVILNYTLDLQLHCTLLSQVSL